MKGEGGKEADDYSSKLPVEVFKNVSTMYRKSHLLSTFLHVIDMHLTIPIRIEKKLIKLLFENVEYGTLPANYDTFLVLPPCLGV